jgi:hypothetical protein
LQVSIAISVDELHADFTALVGKFGGNSWGHQQAWPGSFCESLFDLMEHSHAVDLLDFDEIWIWPAFDDQFKVSIRTGSIPVRWFQCEYFPDDACGCGKGIDSGL